MKHLLFTLLLLFSAPVIFAQADELTATKQVLTIGEKLEFSSEVLGETRSLNVYLPQGYHQDSTKVYPVIYLLDGGLNEDFVHISGLVQFASFPWVNHIPESIVVGISNTDRKRDFTFPTRNKQDKLDFPSTGKSADFIQFLKTEVKPLIEKTYVTDSSSTLIGQSLGGLLATEILFTQPDIFNNYLIVSPSLWWDDQSLLKQDVIAQSKVKHIFIAVGTQEEAVMQHDARALFEKLKQAKSTNASLHFEPMKDCTHADILHLAIYRAFEWMQGTNENPN